MTGAIDVESTLPKKALRVQFARMVLYPLADIPDLQTFVIVVVALEKHEPDADI
ncbi:hypothetical protein F4779DRAFT_614283 [Xylariaceae sp. FL0662B]|nr:hypothetical protein F4779DRAFT_614283 [Xylariaceae sp. FL0662B]